MPSGFFCFPESGRLVNESGATESRFESMLAILNHNSDSYAMPLNEPLLQHQRNFLGLENVLIAPEDLIPYSFDGNAAMQQMPGCIVLTKTTGQVASLRVNHTAMGTAVGVASGPIFSAVRLNTFSVRRASILAAHAGGPGPASLSPNRTHRQRRFLRCRPGWR